MAELNICSIAMPNTVVPPGSKNTKPAELPVQLPNKFELVINLRPPGRLDLGVPQVLLATADQVVSSDL
jgi:hypothetical protein